MKSALPLLLLGIAALLAPPQEEAARGAASVGPQSSCVACHSRADLFPDAHVQMVARFAEDVHALAGLGCQGCHGGDPDPALSDRREAAHDAGHEPHPYRGVPAPAQIPALCGDCHADAAFMKGFATDPRTDQLQEYWTSGHGEALRAGDPKVATCASCHGAHHVLPPSDTRSRVHPTRVAETCAGCHSDASYMQGYDLPIDQHARWRASVHAHVLLERHQLSAPTCNDCHGDHGAAPPGVESVARVCGECHTREAELFEQSTKAQGFQTHRNLLRMAGEQGCSACHEEPDPAAAPPERLVLIQCVACHENHGVIRPSVAMLTPLPDTPCAYCHAGSTEGGAQSDVLAASQRRFREARERLLAAALERGLGGQERFDWLVDQALALPEHNRGRAGHARAEQAELAVVPSLQRYPGLEEEFRRLFVRMRIGKTHYTYPDPAGAGAVRAEVLGCARCHAEEPTVEAEPLGWRTARVQAEKLQELSQLVARADRLRLAAKRGGVLAIEAAIALDQAVDAHVQLQVLVHAFSVEEGGKFLEKHAEGMEHAREALRSAEAALDELSYRRAGLMVFLGLVLVFLVLLALKIRRLPD